MEEGQERTVHFKVRAEKDAAHLLREIRLLPDSGLRAAAQSLVVSTGVVMTSDNRVPKSGQFVIRAPGYTTKVDHYSGTSFYLLDADGHRRFGRVVTGNFLTGFPGRGLRRQVVADLRAPVRRHLDGSARLDGAAAGPGQRAQCPASFTRTSTTGS